MPGKFPDNQVLAAVTKQLRIGYQNERELGGCLTYCKLSLGK